MLRQGAISPQGFQMLRRAVSFMLGKAVLGITAVQLDHLAVTGHLCNNACSRNGIGGRVSLNDGNLHAFQAEIRHGIHQKNIRGNLRGGFLMKGNICDIDRGCVVVLDEFRSGKLGRITLESPSVEKPKRLTIKGAASAKEDDHGTTDQP